ncbi:MAG: Na+/glucose cotransporter, partial [Muribaculaceae bacterium]|nr:Na+/glucose cotransporter [Muribaculaceae bacterium]
GALVSILITIAVDNIKGMDLFNVFQSVLSFIAPPMAAVFVMGVFWKRCTTRAANIVLTFGTLFSIGCGVLYLWVIPHASDHVHFMMLSFLIFVVLIIGMVIISLFGKSDGERAPMKVLRAEMSAGGRLAWISLAVIMIGLYVFFNGH